MDLPRFSLLLMVIIIFMIGVTWAIIEYTIINLNNAGQNAGQSVVKQINDKLDALHEQSSKVLNAQGNLSSHQRSQIIDEFTNASASGGFATKQQADEILKILANKTHG